ncbi:arf/Sar family, other [Saprolegnia diclina VS20]|uniref:Arf/Sar family, other n=1 Tax=Saprolegnia diclina (strain VS20) TaxID=1156394 RepID=T0Q2N3_SAPDV|nr:arf/Sar family, other [Saprolegnia diclina VS20]EQC28821.1 arf/Sar family, other [Saprolegnia diclina VS20]|eukprot:XP_008617816.1 arf/Sar family, other [Saprolegnia diclina VS20]
MLGLDAAGKTTLLYQLQRTLHPTQDSSTTAPITTISTIGFNVERFEFQGLECTLWDVGGNYRLSSIVRHYYEGADAILFVVDTSDRARMDSACDHLAIILASDTLRDAVLLVYANKQDLAQAMSIADVTEALQLRFIRQRWFVQACCATSGDGLCDGLHWLATALAQP